MVNLVGSIRYSKITKVFLFLFYRESQLWLFMRFCLENAWELDFSESIEIVYLNSCSHMTEIHTMLISGGHLLKSSSEPNCQCL